MHAFDRRTDGRTDGQTDGQTEISSQDLVCIPCSAVKMKTTSAVGCSFRVLFASLLMHVNVSGYGLRTSQYHFAFPCVAFLQY